MEEAERLCDRVAIVDHGRIVALDSPENLIKSIGVENRVVFTVDGIFDQEQLSSVDEVTRIEQIGDRVIVYGHSDELVVGVVNTLSKRGIRFRDLRTEQPNLEDVFLAITGREMEKDEEGRIKMRGFRKLTWMEFKLFLRDVAAAFVLLIFPLLMLVMMGAIYGNEPIEIFGGLGIVDVTVPPFAGLQIAIGAIWILSEEVAVERENGVLRRLKATPIRPHMILIARVLRIFTKIVIGMILLITFGTVVYNLQFTGNLFSIIIAFLLSSVSFFAIGFFLASVLPNARTAQIVGMALFFLMLFFSETVIPFEQFPERVLTYSKILPLTHVNLLLRGLWFGGSWGDYVSEVVVLLAIAVVGPGVSSKTFRWE